MITVAGYCPYGCGKTLFHASGNYVTCSWAECPNPTGVADLLEADAAISYHVAQLNQYDFTIHHPLRERIDGSLLGCGLHQFIAGLPLMGGPFREGTYRVRFINKKWNFEEIEDV